MGYVMLAILIEEVSGLTLREYTDKYIFKPLDMNYTFFADNGIRCSCGKNGCWVTEIGAMAVRRKLAEAGVVMPEESQPHGDWIESIYARVKKGDAAIEKVLESVGAQIGSGAARLVHTFNPSILIVGGRLGKLMSLFEPAIQEALLEQTLPIMAESLQIVVSDSGEDHLMGAFATVFDVLMRNPNLQDR
jgi:predicted NBD/HSP70 family sugar kinase